MRKILALTLAGILAIGFTSCNKDEDETQFLGANIKVTVTNLLGMPLEGRTVYLYEDTAPTTSTPPSDAKKQVVTDGNGVAIFDLNFTELNILESQTTLYFAIFYTIGNETFLINSEGITVKRNDEKSIAITIPI